MTAVVRFRCPQTRACTEAHLPERSFQHDHATYEAIDCPACGSTHLVNPPTGRTLDDTP